MKKLITLVIAIVAFSAMAGLAQAAQFVTPDAGSTSALMGIALVGLAAVRRFVR
jgi:Zn-dependent alcohol dehydrogenase